MTDNDDPDLAQTQDAMNTLRDAFLLAANGHNKGTIISTCLLVISIMIDDASPEMKIIALDNVEASLNYLRKLYNVTDEGRTKQ